MNYSISEIASILGASTDSLYEPDAVVSRLLTDSRSLTFASQTLFFALRTKNNDGHRYVCHLHSLESCHLAGLRNTGFDDGNVGGFVDFPQR